MIIVMTIIVLMLVVTIISINISIIVIIVILVVTIVGPRGGADPDEVRGDAVAEDLTNISSLLLP